MMTRLQGDLSGGRRAGMINLVETIESKAVKRAPKKTGNLIHGITSSVNEDGSKGIINATARGTDDRDYAVFVHFGTGVFGPHKVPIVPTEKKALFWQGAKHPMRSVKGMRPNPFLYGVLDEIDPQQVYEAGMMNYIRAKGW